jgi:putative acetyltransferase
MKVRKATKEDTEEIAWLFYGTVHAINRRDYSQEQVNAWAPKEIDIQEWSKRQENRITFVAEQEGQIVGFAELEGNGHIGCFYSHQDWQGKGVGSRLLEVLVLEAKRLRLTYLFTEASITARPFFEHHGFVLLQSQEVWRRGVKFLNYRMERTL